MRNFLVEFIAEELELSAADINDSSHLVRDLGFDSLSFASGVSEIKREFGVVLNKDDVFECTTLGALVELVESRQPATSGAPNAVVDSGE